MYSIIIGCKILFSYFLVGMNILHIYVGNPHTWFYSYDCKVAITNYVMLILGNPPLQMGTNFSPIKVKIFYKFLTPPLHYSSVHVVCVRPLT